MDNSVHRRPVPVRAVWVGFVVVLLALLLGAAHLSYVAGFRIALPSLPIWQNPGGDLSQAVLGSEALLRDRAWHLPLAATDRLLSDGQPVSIVYTDSAPWIAIAAKAAGLDASKINTIGLTACLNFLLQPLAVVALLLATGVRRAEVIALGAMLGSLLPAWYFRTSVHIALSSHWLIVLALALAVRAVRSGVSWAVVGGLCALGAFAIGIHAYLFVMVAAVAMGGLLADLSRDGWPALPRAAMGLTLFLAASAASAWLLGFGVGGGADGFGVYTMNLLSPFVPQISGISELLTGNPRRILDATGGQYEGYNYLGAGILLILAVAIPVRMLAGSAAPSTPRRAAIPLVLALAALTALALSNHVFAGHVQVLSIAVPGQAILNNVRGSGRLFWPVPYALLALALATLDKVPRRSVIALALVLAVALQFLDTATLRRSIQQAYAAPAAPPTPALDPWRHGPLAGLDLHLMPRFLCEVAANQELVRELSLVVLRSGGRVEGGPMARRRPDACADDQSAAATIQPAGSWVEVLLRESLPPMTFAIASRVRQCAPVAFGAACGTGVPSVLGSEIPPTRLTPLGGGERVDLTAAGDGRRFEGPGWSDPEPSGTWTEGHHAVFVLPLGPDWKGGVAITVEALAYAPQPLSGQTVAVSVGGRTLARWQISPEHFRRFEVDVPSNLRTGDTILMNLTLPGALSPHTAEGSPDRRVLGIAVRAVSVRASSS